MTPEQVAAFVNAQAAAALIEMESMKAANSERAAKGLAQAYGEEAFLSILDRYPVSHNAVLSLFHD